MSIDYPQIAADSETQLAPGRQLHDDSGTDNQGATVKTPDFIALAADIRDVGLLRAEQDQQLLRIWSGEVRTADAKAISRAHIDALTVATAINSLPTLSDFDAVVILAAVFRSIQKDNTHIDARRLALASLCDVCVDLAVVV